MLARAYAETASCRPVGFGFAAIPWTIMVEWCRYHGLDHDVTNHVIQVLRRIDNVMIRRANAKKPPPPKKGR